jgi:probable rRNA maturation factor
MIVFEVYNRQSLKKVRLAWLRSVANRALPKCLEKLKQCSVLQDLEEVEVSLVTDAEIAEVHGEFLGDPTPTDVITFHHGEIHISVETAERQCREHEKTLHEELALYLIHGLLHLAGWDDHDPGDAARMAEEQEEILRWVMQPL